MTLTVERRAGALMLLAQTGDQQAYAALLEMLAVVMRSYACARLGAVPWLDDVVQETLLAIHGARHTYDGARPFAPWFYAIASSRLIDAIRRQKRLRAHEVAAETVPERTTRGGHWSELDTEAIRAAVLALPPRQRAVVEALKFHDWSVREAADRFRMSESAVKVTAHRGYRALRRLLQRDDV
jgi:RNA polymerase sigma-70 factor (ECF subfamily)